MELRQVRYFIAVAETSNISRAAQKMFLTQSALSRQIKSLEQVLGQPLLERMAHSIRLTPAGESFLKDARDLIVRADALITRMRSYRPGTRLRVGYAPSLASDILRSAVSAFTQSRDGVRIDLLDLSSKEMVDGLETGELDLALTVGVGSGKCSICWSPLIRAEWQLALHDRHPLARKDIITARDLDQVPLLIFCQKDYPEAWKILLSWFRKHRIRPSIVGECDGVDSMLTAVAARQGVGLLTERASRLSEGRARFLPIQDSPPALCIAAGFSRNRSRDQSLLGFVEELRRSASELPCPPRHRWSKQSHGRKESR